ncbi:hypothetical protein K431DRAFT_285460 [Polychaeton citri CBS 116435]|uniref:Uncharacterized protein n=1 Tax=Polychaeton citri CBS 116435 TaxID=1314669 RepID=A0A9P4Q9N8_9PEZI|nr:hypothetical protein K431DRAFT_285460 [Polychaeton citri CBS 116435]
MVAFYESKTTWRHDDYWKLDMYYDLSAKEMFNLLEARRYYAPKRKDRAILQDSLQRADRGLISYTKLSNIELRALYCQRKNIRPNEVCGSRDWLLGHLVLLDDNPEFHKFTSLPTELRVSVYKHYFASFRSPVQTPSQPPLTRASRLLRAESLRLFYASCEFHFDLGAKWSPGRGFSIEIPDKVLLFASATGRTNLAAIKTIQFAVHGVPSNSGSRGSKPTEVFLAFKLNINRIAHLRYAKFLKTEVRLLKAVGTKINLGRNDAQAVLQSLQPSIDKGFSLSLLYRLRLRLEQLLLFHGLALALVQ